MKIFNKKNLKNAAIFMGGVTTMFVITCMIGTHYNKVDALEKSEDEQIFDKLEELIDLEEEA